MPAHPDGSCGTSVPSNAAFNTAQAAASDLAEADIHHTLTRVNE